MQLGKTLYHQGDLSYFEAVNKETLKNAYQRFEEEGMILVTKARHSKTPPTLKLAPEWTPRRDPKTGAIVPKGRFWDFLEMISMSRREGKNRRDGVTVSTRVLKLADTIFAELFEASKVRKLADEGPKMEETEVQVTKKWQRNPIQTQRVSRL